jgi:hypothetical protein
VASPVPNAAGWSSADVAVTLTATDNPGGSGVRSITYAASGAQTIALTTVNAASAAVSITADGATTLTYSATDNAGNASAPQSLVLKLDKTLPGPTTAAVTGGTRVAAGWYTSPPSVALASTDATSGLAAIRYQFVPHGAPGPSNALPGAWSQYAGPFTAPAGDVDLYAFAVDQAGNAEAPLNLGRFKAATLVTFDDLPGQDRTLNGPDPAGRLHFGYNRWFLAEPSGALTSKNLTFKGSDGVKSALLTLLRPRVVVSLRAYNEASTPTTLTLSCPGQPDRPVGLAPKQLLTVETGWTEQCESLGLASANGWDTHVDDLLLEALPSEVPPPFPTTTIAFDDLPLTGDETPLDGQHPNGLIDWGHGQWLLSGPWEALTSRHLSLNGAAGVRSGTFNLPTPRRLVSLEAYNGGPAASTVTVSCAGQTTVQATLAVGQLRVIRTDWTAPCGAVTISNTNGLARRLRQPGRRGRVVTASRGRPL